MKLVRFGPSGSERPGAWLEAAPGRPDPMLLDVRAMAFDIEDYDARFFACHGLERVANLLRESKLRLLPAAGQRLGPPVARPGKIICLGKNYAAHAREFDAAVPRTPILFTKAGTALNGPGDPVVLPPGAGAVDGEVELALVIGRRTRRAARADALAAVAGYAILNDITDRTAQRGDGQWFRAKSADTFCPLGPFLVTADEIPDWRRLHLVSRINGRVLQSADAGEMICDPPAIIEFISARLTLEPGDIIATGTPAGIGTARQPPIVLQPGDVLETSITGLGCQVNPIAGS